MMEVPGGMLRTLAGYRQAVELAPAVGAESSLGSACNSASLAVVARPRNIGLPISGLRFATRIKLFPGGLVVEGDPRSKYRDAAAGLFLRRGGAGHRHA